MLLYLFKNCVGLSADVNIELNNISLLEIKEFERFLMKFFKLNFSIFNKLQ